MDTSTSFLRQIQSMEAELDPSARVMENVGCVRCRCGHDVYELQRQQLTVDDRVLRSENENTTSRYKY